MGYSSLIWKENSEGLRIVHDHHLFRRANKAISGTHSDVIVPRRGALSRHVYDVCGPAPAFACLGVEHSTSATIGHSHADAQRVFARLLRTPRYGPFCLPSLRALYDWNSSRQPFADRKAPASMSAPPRRVVQGVVSLAAEHDLATMTWTAPDSAPLPPFHLPARFPWRAGTRGPAFCSS